jgi:hypothetical protein
MRWSTIRSMFGTDCVGPSGLGGMTAAWFRVLTAPGSGYVGPAGLRGMNVLGRLLVQLLLQVAKRGEVAGFAAEQF